MPPLDRALALAEVHHVAVMVADDLELDVARVLEVLLDVDVAVAEGGFGLALRGAEVGAELVGIAHHAHAAAAAAGHRLDDDRVADALGDLERGLFAVDRAVAAGQHRQARLLHRLARPRLVAEQLDDARIGPDEADVAGAAHLGEIGALGQEAVAGVNGVGAGDLGGADDRRDVQIAVGALGRADAHVLVGEAHVERVLVGLRVDGDGLDAELAAGVDDAEGDFAAVRDQDLLEHRSVALRQAGFTANSRSPYCTACPFST